ncbi:YncE family protein [Streptomyces gardneri]|uniref:YncE family protein n=1 Tax=Nocardia abscessus TaxID=120957 RepID=UPI001893F850|nr:YncE family protein [Nocardia abscessus]MBF6169201.1 YncE family protein [Streptomyces gardneri]MBF6475286.1 YncE family protein [Nocardia abscessus]
MMRIEIFSTDTDDGTISVIGKSEVGDHELLRRIRVGNAPRGAVKFTTTGRGFVSNTSQNTVSELDPITLEETRRIEVGHGPRGLGVVPGDKYLIVSNSGSDTISIVDLVLNIEVRQIPCGRDPRHMAITRNGEFAFVCIWGDDSVAKLDLRGLAHGQPELVTIVDSFDVGATAHPYSAAITPKGDQLLVANTQAKYLSVLDIASGAVDSVDLGDHGGRAVTFTTDGRYALVSVESTSMVAVIDLDTMQVTRQIPVGPGPRGLMVDPSDETLYVTNFARPGTTMGFAGPMYLPNTLTKVDLKSARLDVPAGEFDYQSIDVGFGPCSVSIVDTARWAQQVSVDADGAARA